MHAQLFTTLTLFHTDGAIPGYANGALEALVSQLIHLTLSDPFTSVLPPPILANLIAYRAPTSEIFSIKPFLASCTTLQTLRVALPVGESIIPTLSCLTARLHQLVVLTRPDSSSLSLIDSSDLFNAFKLPSLENLEVRAVASSCWRGSAEGDKKRWGEACRARGIEFEALDRCELFARLQEWLKMTLYLNLPV
jgi:hypothetical protein